MTSSFSITAFYAPWCYYDFDSEVKDFITSSVVAVQLSTKCSFLNTLKSKCPNSDVSDSIIIEKSLCICLFTEEHYVSNEKRINIVQELLKIFDAVIFDDNTEIQKQLQLHDIEEVPCLSIKTNIGSDRYECTTKALIPKRSALLFTDESQFTSSMEMYNNYHLLRALNGFSLLLERSPQHSGALFNSACILHMIGYPTLAIKFLKSVLLMDQNDSTAHSFLWALATTTDGSCLQACIKCYRELAQRNFQP
jgi:hypothetical protein